jgi:hypothetical protein
MKIIRGVKVIAVVIPAAHVRPRRRHAFALAEWFEQRVFI